MACAESSVVQSGVQVDELPPDSEQAVAPNRKRLATMSE
jgi:hypothetical protein